MRISRLRVSLTVPALAMAMALQMLSPNAMALDEVTLGYPAKPGVGNADIGFGIQLGIFKEEGISIRMVGLHGSAITIPQVAEGTITAAIASPNYVLSALAKGTPLPVRFVYNWRRQSPYSIDVLQDSPIKTVADLKGKKLGVGALTWSNIPTTRAILDDAGVRWQKDIQVVPIGIGPAAWRQLQSGAVDAVNFWSVEYGRMKVAGIPIRALEVPARFENIFTDGILVSSKLIEDNPDLVQRLGRAIAKTTVACAANPQACIKGAWVIDPTLKPAADKQAEWVEQYLPLQRANYAHMLPDGDQPLGYYPEQGWKTRVDILHGAGIIHEKSLPVERLYTNEFVEKFNDFDRDEIVARAKAAH